MFFFLWTWRLKGLLDKEDQESEVIKDSPDSPEPLNKKPRLSTEEVQPPERAKGTLSMWMYSHLHSDFVTSVL